MGCDLVYSNRVLIQARPSNIGRCHIVSIRSNDEISQVIPMAIRTALGPEHWETSYLFHSAGRDLRNNRHYCIEASKSHYFYVDSTGDAWFYKDRASLEAAISTIMLRGASHNLVGTTHYSQVDLSVPKIPVANRYERVIRNLEGQEPETEPTLEVRSHRGIEDPDEELNQILNFEFNRPAPPKPPNPLGIDLEAIARSVLKSDKND